MYFAVDWECDFFLMSSGLYIDLVSISSNRQLRYGRSPRGGDLILDMLIEACLSVKCMLWDEYEMYMVKKMKYELSSLCYQTSGWEWMY